MRKITIVGAGQAGLMIGVGLVRKGYNVTIVSELFDGKSLVQRHQ